MNTLSKDRYTDRLLLRPIKNGLNEQLWEIFQDDGVAKWYGGKWSREKVATEVSKMDEAWSKPGGIHKWIALDKTTKEIVGRGGLSVVNMEGEDQIEVGWVLLQKFWGKGYASEIGKTGLDLAFNELGADHVIAFTEPHNKQSRAVMERLGFTYTKKVEHKGEQFVLYKLTKAEYEKSLL